MAAGLGQQRIAAASRALSPHRTIRAAIIPVTIGAEKEVPLHCARPEKVATFGAFGLELVSVPTAAVGVDEILARCVNVDPAAVIAEVGTVAPVGRRAPRRRARPGRRPARTAAGCSSFRPERRRPRPGTAEAAPARLPGPSGGMLLPGHARGRQVEDLEAEPERRFSLIATSSDSSALPAVSEDVRDVDLRLRRHAPQDGRDERPVSPVGLDRAARNSRGSSSAPDAGEPREGLRRTRDQPGVGHEDPHPGAAVPADRGIGARRRIRRHRLGGRAGTQRLAAVST